MAYVALLDASVLHPWVVCDLLLRLAERRLYRPAWSEAILDELVESLVERMPEREERFRRRREHMEAAFAEAMTRRPERFESAVPPAVDEGDRHVVAAALAARADVIVTDNIRDFALDDLAEVGLLVQTADEFLIHQWWLDPSGVVEEIIAMAASTARPSLTARQVLQSLGRHVPEFAALVAASPELVGAAPE
jgi:predicted nucleic acid-binding protein